MAQFFEGAYIFSHDLSGKLILWTVVWDYGDQVLSSRDRDTDDDCWTVLDNDGKKVAL